MTAAYWTGLLASIALQHLWQSTVLLLLAAGLVRAWPMSARLRSHLWLLAFVLSAAAPLLMFAPQPTSPLMPHLALPALTAPALANVAAAAPRESAAPAQAVHVVADGTGTPGALDTAVMLAWLLGFAERMAGLLRGWRAARALARGARAMPWLEQAMRGALPPDVRIKGSDAVRGPMVVGLRNPCILVPYGLAAELGDVAMRDILNHEIAHVRRRDRWACLVQHALTAVFWWSPALRLIGMRLDLAREMACDAYAAGSTGARKQYARSLLASVDSMARPHNGMLASRIFGTPQALAARVASVLRGDAPLNRTRSAVRSLSCACALAGFVALAYAATPRLAQRSAAATRPASAQDIALVDAAGAGDLARVRELVGAGAAIAAAVAGVGTALIAAARHGDAAMVKTLLALGAHVDVAVDSDGTALIAAAAQGRLPIVELLLAAGARVDAVSSYDESALISAVRGGHIDVVRRLVAQGADVNRGVWADGGRWRTPLNQARSAAMRDYLRSRGATA
jgi:beta-lactamase regulating signal transducer with metallopeptidase domain